MTAAASPAPLVLAPAGLLVAGSGLWMIRAYALPVGASTQAIIEGIGGLTMAHEPDGTTTLRGDVADQAQLHGVLGRVRNLGATLVHLDAPGRAGTVTRRTLLKVV